MGGDDRPKALIQSAEEFLKTLDLLPTGAGVKRLALIRVRDKAVEDRALNAVMEIADQKEIAAIILTEILAWAKSRLGRGE